MKNKNHTADKAPYQLSTESKELIFDLQDELDRLLLQAEALSCAFSQIKFTELNDEIGQLCMDVLYEQLAKAQNINKQLWAECRLYVTK